MRDRALFELAIVRKLRGCDLVKIRIGDLVVGGKVRNRAMVIQQKTKRPVQFELLEPARSSILAWLETIGLCAPRVFADTRLPTVIDLPPISALPPFNPFVFLVCHAQKTFSAKDYLGLSPASLCS